MNKKNEGQPRGWVVAVFITVALATLGLAYWPNGVMNKMAQASVAKPPEKMSEGLRDAIAHHSPLVQRRKPARAMDYFVGVSNGYHEDGSTITCDIFSQDDLDLLPGDKVLVKTDKGTVKATILGVRSDPPGEGRLRAHFLRLDHTFAGRKILGLPTLVG